MMAQKSCMSCPETIHINKWPMWNKNFVRCFIHTKLFVSPSAPYQASKPQNTNTCVGNALGKVKRGPLKESWSVLKLKRVRCYRGNRNASVSGPCTDHVSHPFYGRDGGKYLETGSDFSSPPPRIRTKLWRKKKKKTKDGNLLRTWSKYLN